VLIILALGTVLEMLGVSSSSPMSHNRLAMVHSFPAEYEFKDVFISRIMPLIAINLVVNPTLLSQYLKKSKMNDSDCYQGQTEKVNIIYSRPRIQSIIWLTSSIISNWPRMITQILYFRAVLDIS
jgi:hypothetical protein